MAIEFPHAQVIGMDLAPPSIPENSIPDNCRFEVDDANNDLSHWANAFNVVHVRSVGRGHERLSQLHLSDRSNASTGGCPVSDFWVSGELECLMRRYLLTFIRRKQMYDENFQPFGTPDPGEPGYATTHFIPPMV